MPTKDDLKYFQAMPLEIKIGMTKNRITEWVREFGMSGVYVSFSGGKDSTVLLHIVRELFPDIEAVFVNTGLEYPEIQKFVKTFDNVTILRPKTRFDEVIKKYGYPIISKEVSKKIYDYRSNPNGYAKERFVLDSEHSKRYDGKYCMHKWKPLRDSNIPVSGQCCDVIKKNPLKDFEKKTGKKPITATMAQESAVRTTVWYQNGCNAFNIKRPISNPMSFWTEQDVLQYIKKYNIPIAPVYGDVVYAENPEQMRIEDYGIECLGKENLCTTGCKRTGCIFCGFGCHLEKEPSRFQRLKQTHPKQYNYCMNGGEYVDGVWQPNKEGLGMRHVFEELNRIYGEGFIKY